MRLSRFADRLRRVAAVCIVTFPLPALAAGTPLDPADVDAVVPALEHYIEGFMAEAGIPGVAVGIVADDRLVYARGFGVREMGGDAPVDPETVFQIGSITKSFAAGTEAVLVDRGKLGWSDRVIDHFPALRMYDPWVTRELRVEDLLAQRSGMTPYVLGEMVALGYSRDAMVEAVRHVVPVTSFRAAFGYQNVMHLIAERVVMAASGAPSWEALLREALLGPLGMSATSNTAEAIEANPDHATGHSRAGGSVHPIPFDPAFYEVGAAGNINSNIVDMSRWLRLQINRGEIDGKRIVGEAALTETWKPRVAVSDTAAYATGLVTQWGPAGRLVWHNGGTTGFATYMGFDPDRRFGIVVLTNLALPAAGDAIGNWFFDRVRGLPETDHAAALLERVRAGDAEKDAALAPPAGGARPPRPLAGYAGAYENPIYGRVTVTVDGEALILTIGPLPTRIRLAPWSGDSFTAHFPDALAVGMDDPVGFAQFEPGARDAVRAFALDLDVGALDGPDRPEFVRMEP